MESISMLLTEKMLSKKIIIPEKKEIYQTGIMLILADVINFSLILIMGAITKSFIYSCIYLLLFWTVRRFSGGFHAKTYGICRVVTVGTYIAILLTSKIINNHEIIYTVICDIITLCTMFAFAPIRHPNKKLTDKEIRANKLLSLITTLFFTAISMILIAIARKEGLVISLTLLAIAVLMYVGLLTNRKEGI